MGLGDATADMTAMSAAARALAGSGHEASVDVRGYEDVQGPT